jgi:hypothetical protein
MALNGESLFSFDQNLIFTPKRYLNPPSSNASPLQFKTRLEVLQPMRKVGGATSTLRPHELVFKPQMSPMAMDCFDQLFMPITDYY